LNAMWLQIRKVVEETKKQQRDVHQGNYRQNPALENHSDSFVCVSLSCVSTLDAHF